MRDNKIDYVRALCSLTVIIAHVSAPAWINDIRSFDVVALVLISGMSLIHTSNDSYSVYLWKRVKKLFIPTALMMIAVFSGSYLACRLLSIHQLYSSSQIYRSFLLLNEGSMGYVWIVRVYLVIALLSPIVRKLAIKIKSFVMFVIVNAASVALAFGLKAALNSIPVGLGHTILMDWVYSGFVYSIIAFDGMWVISNKSIMPQLTVLSGLLFVLVTVCLSVEAGHFIFDPSSYKFPPRFYYCIYGIMVGLLLYIIFPQKRNAVARWVSNHSFSVYLWHIILLHAYGVTVKVPALSFLDNYWIIKYFVVTGGSIAFVAIVDYSYKRIKKVK